MRTDRLTIHDTNFARLKGGSIIGPFDVPSADAVREALLELAHRVPQHRVFSRLVGNRWSGRWVPIEGRALERHCEQLVSSLPPGEDDTPRQWVDRMVKPFPYDGLLHISLGSRHFVLWFAHILGDNDFQWFMPTVLRRAGGAPLPPIDLQTTNRLPLTRAMIEHFGKHPGRVAQVLRDPRPKTPAGSELVRVAQPPTYGAETRPAPPQGAAAVRAWRDENCPGVSMGNVYAAAVRAAFEAAGVEFGSPGFRVLVDARRYLPAGVAASGNFTIAIYLEPDDPCSPEAVEAVVRRDLNNGRPLAAMAVSAAKNALGVAFAADGAPVSRLPHLTVSNLGRQRLYEELPGLEAERAAYAMASPPDGPSGITVFLAQIGACVTFNASFCTEVVDRSQVAAALELLAADPVSLLHR
jgi:hypothetical protein